MQNVRIPSTCPSRPATDLGIHLVEMAYARDEARRTARRLAVLRAGKIAAFAAGAGAGAALAHAWQFLAFLVPAAIVLAATALSFARVRLPRVRVDGPAAEAAR